MKLCPQCNTGYPDTAVECPTHGGLLSEIRDLKPDMIIRNTYRIIRKLGQGGMGAVYLAQHTLMDEPQALKFLSSGLSQDEAFTSRFLREVRTLRQVRHKNVVDAGNLEPAEDGTLFFPMEYVDGPDLRSFLNSAPRPFDVKLALNIARGIAEGLGAAHAKGMVHRDIKPENVLMAREDDRWIPKIADFGIVATRDASIQYTQTGSLLLTPFYAAPEQWRGMRAAELDGRTDLYALGGVMFEMLTGQKAFDAENYHGWAQQHLYAAPPLPSSLRPELARWRGLDGLILGLLAKERDDRPRNVKEFLTLLDSIQSDVPRPERMAQPKTKPQPPVPANESVAAAPSGQAPAAGDSADTLAATPAQRKKFALSFELLLFVFVVGVIFVFIWLEHQSPKELPYIPAPVQESNDQEAPPQSPPDPATIWKHAQSLYKHRNYKEALPLLDQACTAGKAAACYDLAEMHAYKFGVGQDLKKSQSLYQTACNGGYADACYSLGEFFSAGTLGIIDGPKALALFTRACDGGSDDGCSRLAISYMQKDDGVLDIPKAFDIVTRACGKNLARSCYTLALMYDRGTGTDKDLSHGASLYVRSCELGYASGCLMAGNDYWSGTGVTKDIAQSDAYFKRGCALGDDYSCKVLKDSK